MKVSVLEIFLLLSIFNHDLAESRGIRRKKLLEQTNDYEASGDYFEVTVNSFEHDNFKETTTKKSFDDMSSDDGVTCSDSNFTDILAGYELENNVLVVFKVNVTANERELILLVRHSHFIKVSTTTDRHMWATLLLFQVSESR